MRELVRKVKNRLREVSGSSGLPGIRAEPAALEAGGLRLVSLAVVPDGSGAGEGGPAIARLLDEENDLRELDALELPVDEEICPDGPRLFAVADGRPRALRVEIVGPGAAGWRLSPESETIETFDDRLQGYEEWYARRHEFYGRDYFEGEGGGASGYEAGSLEQAYRAQSVFVDAVLSEAPFRSSVEFGCAAGAMVRALRGRGIDARGYDLSDYAVSRAPAELKDHVHVGDFSALERMEPVEAVIGQEVFEHIPPQEVGPVFRAIHGIARRWLIFTAPCTPQLGFDLMRRFDELPRDSKGHPIEGHLVQGSWWWWATQATLAGFEVDPVRIRRIRRLWGANSRWWNLYICRRCADVGPEAIRRRMDRLMGSAWEPLRQRLNVRRIAAGRLIRGKSGLVLSCRAQDPGAYAHFGPGVRVEKGRVDCRVDFRLPAEGRVVGDPAEALFLEVSGSHGVHETRVVTTQELLAERGKWIRFHHEHQTRDESGIEFRIYHTGAADLEIGWPVRCEVR